MNIPAQTRASGTSPHVRVDGVTKRFGAIEAVHRASFTVPRGHTLSLLGPSGCGKTTLLRVIAGLDTPDEGSVALGDHVVVDDQTFVRPERRRVGLVFQGGALFPHMTVADNVAYGVAGETDAANRVHQALEMVEMIGFENRMPSELSGGQAQRVALARALAPQPEVLLLDEPFASLDAELRVRVRSEVAALLRSLETTAVFVTHDQEEAFVVGDRVAVMKEGRVIQSGSPSEIYERPVSPWVARFVGEANLIPGRADGGFVETLLGTIPLAEPLDGTCVAVVRPEHVELAPGESGVVESVEFYGHDTAYDLRMGESTLTARAMAAPRLQLGDGVRATYVGPPVVAFLARQDAAQPA